MLIDNMSTDYGSLNAEMIGIALGSPCQTPLPVVHTAEVDDLRSTCRSPESTSTVKSGSNKSSNLPEKDKSQRTKWKSFGGLFRKKSDPCLPSTPLYKVELSFQQDQQRPHQPHIHFTPLDEDERRSNRDGRLAFDSSNTAERTSNGPSSTGFPKTGVTSPRRMRSFRSKLKERRAEAPSRPATLRSQTMPTAVEEKGQMHPLWPLDKTTKRGPAMPRTSPASLLEVEIPSIKLERYSVMFSGLLPPESHSLPLAQKQAQKEDARSTDMAHRKASQYRFYLFLAENGNADVITSDATNGRDLLSPAPRQTPYHFHRQIALLLTVPFRITKKRLQPRSEAATRAQSTPPLYNGNGTEFPSADQVRAGPREAPKSWARARCRGRPQSFRRLKGAG